MENASDIENGKVIQKLLKAIQKQNRLPQCSPSIYMVPGTLRDLNPSAFSPRVLSIGPLHKKYEKAKMVKKGLRKSNDPELQVCKSYKEAYMQNLFSRLHCGATEAMKECFHNVHAEIGNIKACYEGDWTTYNDHDFAYIMVIDGCFIVELIYRSKINYISENDPIMKNTLLNFDVKQDLVLLENQIPFFVLEIIFDCTIRKLKPSASLTNLLLLFLEDMNPFGEKLAADNLDGADANHRHILGLLHNCSRPSNDLPSALPKTISYSASDFARAGVKFEPIYQNVKGLLAMEFKTPFRFPCCAMFYKPTLKMPVLHLENYTETLFRNLIAYEQCSINIKKHITVFAYALDLLVDTEEDVLKLVESEVIVNNLGSSKEAMNVINSLCKEVIIEKFFYTSQWEELDKYCKRFFPKHIAWLKRTYFSNPWSIIGLIAGIILFALTVVQTIFDIRAA